MVPTASTATGAALQIKGISGAANTCTAAEEGAIRYNATAKPTKVVTEQPGKLSTN